MFGNLLRATLLAAACVAIVSAQFRVELPASTEADHQTQAYRTNNDPRFGELPKVVLRRGRDVIFNIVDSTQPTKKLSKAWLDQIVASLDDGDLDEAVTVTPKETPQGGSVAVTLPGGTKIGRRVLRLRHPEDFGIFVHVAILFDPFKAGDASGVHLTDAAEAKAFAMNDWGLQIQAGVKQPISTVVASFNFYQFLPFVLDVMEGKFDKIDALADKKDLADAVKVAAYWHEAVRSGSTCKLKRGGVVAACWDSASFQLPTNGGSHPRTPGSWLRVSDIVDEFVVKKNQPVAWGQCFVFGSLLSTVTRALGIPARATSNFASCSPFDPPCGVANQDKGSGAIIWNFHVWNEFWINNQWYQMDGTFGAGVSKIDDILNNVHDGNAAYVADEVKAFGWKGYINAPQFPKQNCKKTYIEANLKDFTYSCGRTLVTQDPLATIQNLKLLDRIPAYKGTTANRDQYHPKFPALVEISDMFRMQRTAQELEHNRRRLGGGLQGEATLEIKVSPAQPFLGDTITIAAKRNDPSFWLDEVMKVKIFLVATDYTSQPLAVVYSKVLPGSIGKNDDTSKAGVTLKVSDYVNGFAVSPYFEIVYVWFSPKGAEPSDAAVLRHFEAKVFAKASEKNVTSPQPKSAKQESNPLDFHLSTSLYIAPPSFLVLPYVEKHAALYPKLAKHVSNKAPVSAEFKDALKQFYSALGATNEDGIVDVHQGSQVNLVALMHNPTDAPYTHITLQLLTPTKQPVHVSDLPSVPGGETFMYRFNAALNSKRVGHDYPQIISVILRSSEIAEVTGQLAVAVTGTAPINTTPIVLTA